MEMEEDRIRISLELFPNLVLHTMSCAGLGFFDEGYRERFGGTLTEAERSAIKEMAEGFQVNPPGVVGPLFQKLFQIPCYFPTESTEEIALVYTPTREAIEEGSFEPFAHRYPSGGA